VNRLITYLFRYRWLLAAVLLLLIIYCFSLPRRLFSDPTSTVIDDREGGLLGARIAADGQWRFPERDDVPDRFKTALLLFEDRHFYYHPGFNPVSMGKALLYNIRNRGMKRGGSTISMQVIRLSRKGRRRTLPEKVIETILATRLELRHSKGEILALYASHAPFGGNVVGLDAAAWRYYGRSPEELSWAEAATLALLPNAPSLIFPGRNQEVLFARRDRLLDELHRRGHIDRLTCELAKHEPLPGKPYPLPQLASHLLDGVAKNRQGQRVRTTIDAFLQQMAVAVVNEHNQAHRANEIHNAAAIILHVPTGEVLAYVGNTQPGGSRDHGHQVDIVTAPRSTGSILKPLLYALMTQEGMILPGMLVPDIPTQIAGYSPKNYFMTYDGAVPARRSLSRSLNVPSVRMLRDYGVEKFHHYLQEAGMRTLVFPPGHYGLSLILGGAEGTLWDIAGMFASMSRVLGHPASGKGPDGLPAFREPAVLFETGRLQALAGPAATFSGPAATFSGPAATFSGPAATFSGPAATFSGSAATFSGPTEAFIDPAAVWLTYGALVEVNRPDAESGWELYSSQGRVAWKTGTSFGGRDAWAVGTTKDFVVGVWAGNATGEGRPGLTGLGTAAPIMFDLFNYLPAGEWFDPPYDGMSRVVVCRDSGHRAGMYCTEKDTVWVHNNGLETPACPYHQLIHLDRAGRFRVSSQCEEVAQIRSEPWFVLPPAMEWFYKTRNPAYRTLPPFRADCLPVGDTPAMDLIYPRDATTIFIPREMDGMRGVAVFEVAHRNPSASLFWHLDDDYLGETKHFHRMALSPESGFHTLTVVDQDGESLVKVFEVVK